MSDVEKSLQEVWPGYLEKGYFDHSGNLILDYVSRDWIVPFAHDLASRRPALTATQIRRFFQHCRAIEAKLRAKTSTWAAEEAAFHQLDVAAADAFGKMPPKIPELFHDFIKINVAAVKNAKDFLKGFLPHFEALVGFGSGIIREQRN
jgi:CRISPR type III-A-associated protein Csm2